jgi:hypothetical protein
MMKRIFFLILAFALLCGAAEAYILVIEAPPELQAGVPLVVTGNTTFPEGTQFDIVLYKLQFTAPEEIGRRVIIVDDSKTFDASFATTGLPAGQYKIEVQFLEGMESRLGSDSVTIQQVNLVDRSNEIYLTTGKEQTLDEALLIEGYIPDIGVATITLKINGPEGFSLPDQFVRTTTQPGKIDGYFSKRVSVTEPGNYYVNFYDQKGFITQVKYSVTRPAPALPSPALTETVPPSPTATPGLTFPLTGCIGCLAAMAILAWKKGAS